MADGDILLDDAWVENATEGTRVDVLVVESSDHPPGYRYSFQFFHPDDDDPILRYDNYHERDDVGWHHKHQRTNITAITPPPTDKADIIDLYDEFLHEVRTHD